MFRASSYLTVFIGFPPQARTRKYKLDKSKFIGFEFIQSGNLEKKQRLLWETQNIYEKKPRNRQFLIQGGTIFLLVSPPWRQSPSGGDNRPQNFKWKGGQVISYLKATRNR